jgi:hypothetical protein
MTTFKDFVNESKKNKKELSAPIYMIEVRNSLGKRASHFSFYKFLNRRQLKQYSFGYIEDIVNADYPVITRSDMGVVWYYSYDFYLLVEEVNKILVDRNDIIVNALNKDEWRNLAGVRTKTTPLQDYIQFKSRHNQNMVQNMGFEDPNKDIDAL